MDAIAKLIDQLGEDRAVELLKHFAEVKQADDERVKLEKVLRGIDGYSKLRFDNVPDSLLKLHNELASKIEAMKQADLY